ncbi:carotenoid oxygenase [Radiomyces spectabilis]|uniref:carotenoid oxygenase n=1 Tax=Radiomyces spectabilis TaxID=64574 RepID=UPI00221F9964|nr:carotenoid oxygenase [Radiomyces spectabilis]KAI8390964.1 carotenoid oxygenase [Radiomyces spectabilis]
MVFLKIVGNTGPGTFTFECKNGASIAIQHAFDGLPFMHRFELSASQQKVRYNSRNLASQVEKDIIATGETQGIFFGHMPLFSVWQHIKTLIYRFDRMVLRPPKWRDISPSSQMVGVTATPNYPLPPGANGSDDAHVLVSKTDANMMQHIHSDTLEPQQLFDYGDFHDQLQGNLSAAHHQYDPETNTIYNITLDLMTSALTVFSIDGSGKTTVLAKITHRLDKKKSRIRPAYIHSFWLTKEFIIIPEAPLYYTYAGIGLLAGGPALSCFHWDPQAPTYLHVIRRRSNVCHVASIAVDPFFTFHVGSAWDEWNEDEKDHIIELNCSAYSNGDILYQVHSFGNPLRSGTDPAVYRANSFQTPDPLTGVPLPPTRQSSFGDFRRYVIRLNSTTCESGTIVANVEFLRYRQDPTLSPHQYMYGCQFERASMSNSERYSLIKVDIRSGTVTAKYDHDGYLCSEPIFAPKPGAIEEDDGVLLSFVNQFRSLSSSPQQDRCFLVVLDAKTLKEVARCHIGSFTANTFHGSFVNERFENVSIN